MMGIGFIIMIFFWLLVILGVLWLVSNLLNKNNQQPEDHSKALDILQERYARGEINKKEFIIKKKDLS